MTPNTLLSRGLVLTACAGFIDAIGYIELGGYYTSFMSGNTTQLGANLAMQANGHALLVPIGLIVSFFGGSFLGSLITHTNATWGTVRSLGMVLFLLTLSLLLTLANATPILMMLPLAIAAGAQNSILRPNGAARIGTTFVTGTLFNAADDLAKSLLKAAPKWRWVQHLLIFLALMLGAFLGAAAYAQIDIYAICLPATIYLAFFIEQIRSASRLRPIS